MEFALEMSGRDFPLCEVMNDCSLVCSNGGYGCVHVYIPTERILQLLLDTFQTSTLKRRFTRKRCFYLEELSVQI